LTRINISRPRLQRSEFVCLCGDRIIRERASFYRPAYYFAKWHFTLET